MKSFILPVLDNTGMEEELNRFLRGHRVLQVSRNFCAENGGYWAILVEYMEGDASGEVTPATRSEKKDYSKELSQDEYKAFLRLKDIRKSVAKKFSLPAYLIFTNEELAVLSRLPMLTEETAKSAKGIAPGRLNDYLPYFMEDFNRYTDETGGELDGENRPF